jgi:hypothetical protein
MSVHQCNFKQNHLSLSWVNDTFIFMFSMLNPELWLELKG